MSIYMVWVESTFAIVVTFRCDSDIILQNFKLPQTLDSLSTLDNLKNGSLCLSSSLRSFWREGEAYVCHRRQAFPGRVRALLS